MSRLFLSPKLPDSSPAAVVSTARFAERFNICRSIVTGALLQHGLITKDPDSGWQLTDKGLDHGGAVQPSDTAGHNLAFPLDTFRSIVSLPLLRSSAAGSPVGRLPETRTSGQLSHNDLAAHLDLPVTELLGILSELAWIQRAPAGGWSLGPIGHVHGGSHAVASDGTPTVHWPAEIANSPYLTAAANEFHQPGLGSGDSAGSYACIDGHQVACRSEVLIDNWLYHHEIPHAYGRPVPAGDGLPLISGFYLPAPKVYIEFWRFGIDPDTAIEVHQKRALYRLYRCRLVEVTPANLQDLDSHLTPSLARHGVSVPAFA